ncbi:MAG: hypothetical protein F4Z71_04860 [Gammaproteobacteria bacterium]|nr:hypothetical protein [Gammaproteobacteria bacterium]MYE30520.1 hypothetical protein [Gammaproteobacteria bacterium]
MQKTPNSNANIIGKKEEKIPKSRDLCRRPFPARTQATATIVNTERNSSLISGSHIMGRKE